MLAFYRQTLVLPPGCTKGIQSEPEIQDFQFMNSKGEDGGNVGWGWGEELAQSHSDRLTAKDALLPCLSHPGTLHHHRAVPSHGWWDDGLPHS